MPTENRSSNTEMAGELLPCPFCGVQPQITKHHREDIYSFMHRCQVLGPISWGFREDQQAHAEKWNARVQPAPQPHPEPIAWMVGTAFWWTKEEAERDAAETGLPIVGLGPMTALAPEHHQGEPVAWMDPRSPQMHATISNEVKQHNLKFGGAPASAVNGYTIPLYTHADPGEVERLRSELVRMNETNWRASQYSIKLQAKLDERDALLADISRRHWSGVDFDLPADLAARVKALSASAEPQVKP